MANSCCNECWTKNYPGCLRSGCPCHEAPRRIIATTVRSCGFYCEPAVNPGDGKTDAFDCAHPEASHYSIDGEAVGCMACEEEHPEITEPIAAVGATR